MTHSDDSRNELTGERRTNARQISVLINAGVAHKGKDALCRIRNLSSGGVMIECGLPFAENDPVELQLRSGHQIGGMVRWVRGGQAGVAFDEPEDADLVKAGQPTLKRSKTSLIGYPLFRREATAYLENARGRTRVPIMMISPSGLIVQNSKDWGGERLFTVKINNLGQYKARVADGASVVEGEPLNLVFVEPPLYKVFSAWLEATPLPLEAALPAGPAMSAQAAALQSEMASGFRPGIDHSA